MNLYYIYPSFRLMENAKFLKKKLKYLFDFKGIINCNVSDANPRPSVFTFYKDNVELVDPTKYTLHVNAKENTASLKVGLFMKH